MRSRTSATLMLHLSINYIFPPPQTPIYLFPLLLFLVGIKLGLIKALRSWVTDIIKWMQQKAEVLKEHVPSYEIS